MSKQVSNNPRKSIPALRTTNTDYISLMTLAVRIVSFMTTNIAIYATPNPVLADVTTQVTALKTAIGAGGSKWNRGSRASIEIIRAEAETLRSLIIALIAYAQNITTVNTSQQTQALYNFLLSGISVKKERAVTGKRLDVIRNFKIARVGANLESIEFSWRKPKGMIKGQPAKMYKIEAFSSESEQWEEEGTTTTTKFTVFSGDPLLNLGDATIRITPFNKNDFGQPYIFKVQKSLSVQPPPPFILTGGLASNVITWVHTESATYPYPNIKIEAVDSDMTYYLSSAPAIPIEPGRPSLIIGAGSQQTMTIAAFRTALSADSTYKYLNVRNTGLVAGDWIVTLFV